MNRLFTKLFDIREGEGARAALMFAYIFLVITAIMILKPVRSSLFLINIGVAKLPFVYIFVAIIAASVNSMHSRFRGGARLNVQIYSMLVFSIASLILFRVLIHIGQMDGWLLYVFYIWVSVFSVLTATQFWLLANRIFNAREAKRLFGFIGAGGISGGIFGGYITNYLAPRLQTENLLLFCMGFLVVCIFLLWRVWDRSRESMRDGLSRKPSRRREVPDNPVRMLFNSRYLAIIAGLVGVGVIVAQFADYQFSAVARSIIVEKDKLTAFFGFWMSNINIASLVIQLFVTGFVIKRFGVSTSLFFLPAGLFAGSLAILIDPRLASAVMAKFSDGALKHSINKSGSELLALPIPPNIKTKAKTFIDVVVDNVATGVAGLLLLLLALIPGFSVRHISIASIVFLAFWLYLIVKVKGEYINSFRLAIEKRTIDLDEQALNMEDASLFESFTSVLEGTNERQILYVLDLLEDVRSERLAPYLRTLAGHPSPKVRSVVLRLARHYEEPDLSDEARKLVDSHNQEVKTEAIEYLYHRSGDKLTTLKTFLEHRSYLVRGAAVICAAREWSEQKETRKEIDINALLGEMMSELKSEESDDEKRRFFKINAARVVGIAGDPELYPYLDILLSDDSPDVLREAIESAGLVKAKEFIPVLIRHLAVRHVRKYAREALASYGEEVVEALAAYMNNPMEDERIRLGIPGVLARIGSQLSINTLSEKLEDSDFFFLYEVIRALNKLRENFPDLRYDKHYIEKRTYEEAKQYYRILTFLYRQQNPEFRKTDRAGEFGREGDGAAARRLLVRALEERLDYNLEMIFKFLGLRYKPRDMLNAYLGVMSNRMNLRANAIEFLDNVLKPDLKRLIIPIVESTSVEDLISMMRDRLGYEIPGEDECIGALIGGPDGWLKICAIYLAANLGNLSSIEEVRRLAGDADPIVRETALYYLAAVDDRQ